VLGQPLLPSVVASIAGTIAANGANIDRIGRLADRPVTCIEFDVSGAHPAGLRTALAKESVTLGVDIAVQRGGLHRRAMRLVVMDVDSTLLQDEAIELLAARAGCADEVAKLTAAAMRGELDFARALHHRVALLAGLDAAIIDEMLDGNAASAGGQDADPDPQAARVPVRCRERRLHPGHRPAHHGARARLRAGETRWRSATAGSPAGSPAR